LAADRIEVAATGIMDRLREATSDLHAQAEGHPFQVSLVRGTVATDDYARWLAQMLLVHAALEGRLAELRSVRSEYAPVIRDDLFQADRLRADLLHHGVNPEALRPLPATAEFVSWIDRTARERPAALFGAYYVLEGSKNGNRFIAKALMRRTGGDGAVPADGYGYLDPHGERQRPLWAEFRQTMNALSFTPEDADAMEDAARRTFTSVTRLSDDLVKSRTPTA
jgi:heme oxygenase